MYRQLERSAQQRCSHINAKRGVDAVPELACGAAWPGIVGRLLSQETIPRESSHPVNPQDLWVLAVVLTGAAAIRFLVGFLASSAAKIKPPRMPTFLLKCALCMARCLGSSIPQKG